MIRSKLLKSKALAAFRANYWRCVVVALIAVLMAGGLSSGVKFSLSRNDAAMAYDFDEDGSVDLGEFEFWFFGLLGEGSHRQSAMNLLPPIIAALVCTLTVSLLIKLLVINPLSLGCQYFFLRNSERPAGLEEIGRAFSPAWWHNVTTLFLLSLFTALWSLLFIIPGLIKMYSYRLASYIQAENPDMSGTEAIKRSRQLMDGHKWEALGFDLSFLGWYLLTFLAVLIVSYANSLSGFSAGGLSGITTVLFTVLWIGPYKSAADAELYKAIRDGAQVRDADVQPVEVNPVV